MRKLTNEQFIAKAKQIHGGKFIYDKTDVNNRDENGKVIITCRKHGDFKLTPNNHTHKTNPQGCPRCKSEKTSSMKTKSAEKFEQEATEKHKWKYKYHDDYIKSNIPIRITCPIHGEFKLTLTNI